MKALLRVTPAVASYGRELRWVLARAFGPVPTQPHPPENCARAVELTRRLSLGGRIAERVPRDTLEQELGLEAARGVAFERLRLQATNRELAEVMQQVNQVAGSLGAMPIWLKFAALSARGFTTEGVREARDVDLLLSDSAGDELYAALLRRDFKAAGRQRTAHQLPPLLAPSGAAVEVHRFVWGLRLGPANRDATFDDFLATGASVSLADGSMALRDELLAAHALVHAIAQHGSNPIHYAPFRVLADLIMLKAWQMAGPAVHAPIAAHLSEVDVFTACSLARALDAGTALDDLLGAETALLERLLAASLDADFQSALGVERLGRMLREQRTMATIRRAFRTAPTNMDTSHELEGSDVGARVSQLARACAGYVRLAWRTSRVRR